jgi:uncharacterized membrane-anchored protein
LTLPRGSGLTTYTGGGLHFNSTTAPHEPQPRKETMNPRINSLLAALALVLAASAAEKADSPFAKIKWTIGPATAALENHSEIAVPAGFRFANGADTRMLKQSVGEPVSGREVGMMIPEKGDWSVMFSFHDDGYVKDDDKDKLDADKLLKAITEGNEEANKERRKAGVPPLHVTGWDQKPFYDQASHTLQWCIRAESEGRPIVNYNTRLLGRRGIMQVVLICDPDQLQATLPQYRELIGTHHYKTGENYAEYRPGDKVAQYGLAALVLGGAAVGAAKLGLFAALAAFLKKGWKLLVVGVAAVGAWIKKLITGRGRRPGE